MKRFILVVAAVATLSVNAVQYDAVFDDVNMLNPATTAWIREFGNEINAKGKAQFTVKIVADCKDTLTDGRKFFNDTGIGDKDKNNGLLLYINATNFTAGRPNKVRLLPGYGLEGMFPDGKCGRILDAGLEKSSVDEKVLTMVALIKSEFDALGDKPVPTAETEAKDTGKLPLWALILFWTVIAIIIIVVAAESSGGEYSSSGGFSGGGGFGGGSSGGGGFGGGSCGGGGAGR